MKQKHKFTGALLSIAAFAMLQGALWLHSPLSHFVNLKAAHQRNALHSCVSEPSTQDSHANSCSTHSHFHYDSNVSEPDQSSPATSDDCPGHQHKHEDCQTCLLLTLYDGDLPALVEIVSHCQVQILSPANGVFVPSRNVKRDTIRGPPVQA